MLVQGKNVGGAFKEYYKGLSTNYVTSDITGGVDYIFQVRAVNSCGKSGWSENFIVHIPLVIDPNAINDVSEQLRKGHLWLECFDSKEEREFWFHTM